MMVMIPGGFTLQAVVTVGGLVAVVGLLSLLFCHYLGGWTWIKAWLFSSREEKMVLTKQGTRHHFNPNGYMVSSESDLNISGRGSFRRFDNTDTDFHLFRQGSNSSYCSVAGGKYVHHQHLNSNGGSIPPQPLRPAPHPPAPLNSQSSLDSVFNTAPSSPAPLGAQNVPRIPPPPPPTHHYSGGGSTSSSSTPNATSTTTSGAINQRIASSTQRTTITMGDAKDKLEGGDGGGGGGGASSQVPPPRYSSTNPFLSMLQEQHGSSSSSSSIQTESLQNEVEDVRSRQARADLFYDMLRASASSSSSQSTSTPPPPPPVTTAGLSMGEILFSAPPVYQHQPHHQPVVRTGSLGTVLPSPLFSNTAASASTPPGSPKLKRSPQHSPTPHRYSFSHQSASTEAVMPSGSSSLPATGPQSPTQASGAAPSNSSSSSSPASIRRASYPNRKEYTPHDSIPKSEFPQHIPYVPSFHHHHHHLHGKGSASCTTGGGVGVGVVGAGGVGPHHHHHLHYLQSSSPSSSTTGNSHPGSMAPTSLPVQPFLEEQEEPPEEPTTNHTLTQNPMPPLNSVLDSEREDLTNRIMLETMREEIRIANERMADATKSLMMDDVFLPPTTSHSHQSPAKRSLSLGEGGGDKGNKASTDPHPPPLPTNTTCSTVNGGSVEKEEEEKGAVGGADYSFMSTSCAVTSLINSVVSNSSAAASIAGRRSSTPTFSSFRAGSLGSPFTNGILPTTATTTKTTTHRPTSLLQRSNSNGSAPAEDRLTRGEGEPQPGPSTSFGVGAGASFSGNNSIMSNVVTAIQSGLASSSRPPSVGTYLFKQSSRSFNLRQSSTDSIGSDVSDLSTSPTGDGNLPNLQRALSCDSVCSDTSVVLGELDPPHFTGHLCVGLEYDSETADLLVNVMEAKELVGPDPDPHAPFDSYVRVYLLPDKTTNMQTRVYRKSLNPIYKEKFMFGLEMSELQSRSLVFYLYATDKRSNTLIGEVELKLGDLDLSQPSIFWLALSDTAQRGAEFGEVMFSLSYLPTAERLTVVVVKARNLRFPQERETGDPFVKVYLLQKGKKVSKKKSSTKRGERNPIFNEAMIFSIPPHALQTIHMRITVADSLEAEGRAYSVGHVIVGATATGKPLSHWNQMLSSLRKPIAMWHALRR